MMTRHPSVNVLVTGLGPYPAGGRTIDPNISHVLTTLLPPHLAANTAVNPSPNHIKITTLGYPIKTEYGFIRAFCRALYGTHPSAIDKDNPASQMLRNTSIDIDQIDLIIHLGEARGWQFMSIERMAFKQGFTSSWWGLPPSYPYYQVPDNKGETVHDLGPCPWDNVPMGVQSALDIDAVAEGANAVLQNRDRYTVKTASSPSTRGTKSNNTTRSDDLALARFLFPGAVGELDDTVLADHTSSRKSHSDIDNTTNHSLLNSPIEIKPHREAGFYCCGFTNYESLANCYVNGRIPNVLFCHIPGLEDERSLAWQKEGVLAVVVSAVNEVVRQRS